MDRRNQERPGQPWLRGRQAVILTLSIGNTQGSTIQRKLSISVPQHYWAPRKYQFVKTIKKRKTVRRPFSHVAIFIMKEKGCIDSKCLIV